MKKPHFSIVIPVYNGAKTIGETIGSILSQSFTDFELIVQDNDSDDDTARIVSAYSDPRVKYYKNSSNLGYSQNLREGKKNCLGDILFLMAADDILLEDALDNTHSAFRLDENIGAVTRPYYWYTKDVGKPVRETPRFSTGQNEVVSIDDKFSRVSLILNNEILGQLSGLAVRMKFVDTDYSDDPWVSHGYPLASIFKKHPVVFLKDDSIAVRIGMNETRKSSTYDCSPMKSWVDLFEKIYHEPKFEEIKSKCIREIVAVNYIGLVQIKNFGEYSSLLKEIFYLIRYRWTNIFSLSYWFFSLGTLVVPSSVLLPMVDWYKEKRGVWLKKSF